jgi:hypothetical protein
MEILVKSKKTALLILAGAILLTACNNAKPSDVTTSSVTETTERERIVLTESEELPATEEPVAENKYEFNPHLYSKKLGDIIPKEHYEALYNLIDALREGRDTFECASEEAYKWATDDGTLNNLFPAACMKVSGKSKDGSVPFENGTGRIYLNMPAEEFVIREKQYEAEIEEILNKWLEPDDNEFEKVLKLYDYMESTFTYGEVNPSETGDGADYKAFQLKTGVCDHISSIYAYLLMQAGVEALNIGTYEDNVCHAWTYVIVDGKSYHVDATWSLKSYLNIDYLRFDYFMMSADWRTESGCPLNDITVPLLPRFWANYYEGLDLKTADNKYDVLQFGKFERLDEANKILYYTDALGNSQQLSYA